MGCGTSYPKNLIPFKRNNGRGMETGTNKSLQQSSTSNYPVLSTSKIFPTCITGFKNTSSPQGRLSNYSENNQASHNLINDNTRNGNSYNGYNVNNGAGYPNNFQIPMEYFLRRIGYTNSSKMVSLKFNEDQKFANDPRLPLNRRQIFSLNKSWKGISRNMDMTGVIMFIKYQKKFFNKNFVLR
ncbi:unnamed protein product [Gordionus sp. m RMFG-2023]